MTQKEQGYEYDGKKDAEDILENDMCRRNWGSAVRDNVAKSLVDVVKREIIAKSNGR